MKDEGPKVLNQSHSYRQHRPNRQYRQVGSPFYRLAHTCRRVVQEMRKVWIRIGG